MRFTIRLLSFAALLGSIAWFWSNPDYEPAVAIITSLAAFLATFVTPHSGSSNQTQRVTSGATGIQAGGAININDSNVAGGRNEL